MERGATLVELVVACAVVVLVLTGVTVVLFRSVYESRLSGTLNDLNAISIAVKSADLQGELADTNGNGDYFDDLVQKQYLSKVPSILPSASYRVLTAVTGSGVSVYYVTMECNEDVCLRIIKALDEKVDLGDGASSGQIQWIE